MTKYDELDPRTELEQVITADLKQALEKRGFTVRHNGTPETHSPGGRSDIEVWDDSMHINVEVTKSKKSAQDREWQAIKDHFENTKRDNISKKCFVWFVSPETYYRTINSMKDWNFAHADEPDQKMFPFSFENFELFVGKLTEAAAQQYTKQQIIDMHAPFVEFVDDENVLRHLYQDLFSADTQLKAELEEKEGERHQRVVEELVKGFKKLEQKLREERIALGPNAIKTVIYLVFIKLYEEKKEKEESKRNRFTLTSFQEYQENVRDRRDSIHKLFDDIKSDSEIRTCGLLTDDDNLIARLKDKFVIEHFIKPFEEYTFYTTKVDGLGAAYEVLGKLSGKDRTAGQFFTPENVVKFMVKLAKLDAQDVVYDPACGTARFLTYAMEDMEDKAKGERDEEEMITHIRRDQLFGTDDDPTVAKLAKMNMYIHGDGKTNIKDEDGLTQYGLDSKIDVILTNPLLGEISYQRDIYDDEFKMTRMELIPKKNVTEEKLKTATEKISELQTKLRENLELTDRERLRLQKRIEEYETKKVGLVRKIAGGQSEFKITGTQMKGGALFINACKHYLKTTRASRVPSEWRGGKLLIILDEGVLNTDDYTKVREFIKRDFYIKAIISLTSDTFVPVSNTSTKTSIVYAIKKEDPDAIQKEPIFYAHAEKVGVNTRKHICPNHLFGGEGGIIAKYREFETAILSSYEGDNFKQDEFLKYQLNEGAIDV